jgi:hypothetical protein
LSNSPADLKSGLRSGSRAIFRASINILRVFSKSMSIRAWREVKKSEHVQQYFNGADFVAGWIWIIQVHAGPLRPE